MKYSVIDHATGVRRDIDVPEWSVIERTPESRAKSEAHAELYDAVTDVVRAGMVGRDVGDDLKKRDRLVASIVGRRGWTVIGATADELRAAAVAVREFYGVPGRASVPTPPPVDGSSEPRSTNPAHRTPGAPLDMTGR